MSKTWKWILGVLAALVVIAVAAGAFFVWQNHMALTTSYRVARPQAARPQTNGTPAPNSPTAPTPPAGQQGGPMMPYGYGFRNNQRQPLGGYSWRGPMMSEGPMMNRRGFSPLGGFGPFGWGLFFLGGLFRLIVPLGVLVLVALIAYQMGKNAGASAVQSTVPPSSPEPTGTPQRGRKVAKS